MSGAAASRAVREGRPQRSLDCPQHGGVVEGVPPLPPRKTVPGSMSGDTSTVGTRTPKRVKSNPYSPALLSGGTAPTAVGHGRSSRRARRR